MMRTIPFLVVFLIMICCQACETDPEISMRSQPSAVIYAIIDDSDTVHNIVVEKTFGANFNPAIEAKIYDSLFFKEIKVQVFHKPNSWNRPSIWKPLEVYTSLETNKEEGYFASPNRAYYYFFLHPQERDSIMITLNNTDQIEVRSKVEILNKLRINTPKEAQQYIYLSPKSTWKVQWDHSQPGDPPHPMNEIDVSFEFIEETSTGTHSKYVEFQNILWAEAHQPTYREMSITYDEFIKEVLQQIPENKEVLRTFLGNISIHIAGGDTNLVQYKQYLNGFSDYHPGSFSNIENGYGLVTSVTHTYRDSLRFDYETRQTLINENRLKKLKISPWTLPKRGNN